MSALTKAPFAMVITDPSRDDNPIVYVNDAFTDVTGYSRAAAIGRNCRFLQGTETQEDALQDIRDAVGRGDQITTDIRNYRADGTPFWNRLMIAPLTDDGGKVRYFLGVQMALPESGEKPPAIRSRELDSALSEIQHRVKNHLSMIVGMIRVQARTSSAREEFETLSHRIEALQLLYEEMSEAVKSGASNDNPVSLGSYLSRVANAIAHLDGRRGVRVNIDADAITIPFEDATRLGLITSEIMTNAMQHAFVGRDQGIVEMRLKELSNGTVRVQVSDDGIGIPEETDWPSEGSLGGRIVQQLVEALNGSLSVARGATGTIVTVDMPKRDSL
ncbi:PAS domain-containing protein [Histidinibacterium aquaticum]|uniref:histidine kinase n=1 Tax=Histidinibacterium aquaticum TaxID=2613962 RepID=A0A5J5GH26_9RHOB|nr:PAS domain-containing protein [Histidinibacterium aquaticum]KAA9007043.1 PAS domain-containing protein [Histidinibacterium aquaticum]